MRWAIGRAGWDADRGEAAQATGFNAIGEGADGLDAGTTVISYRGTNGNDPLSS